MFCFALCAVLPLRGRAGRYRLVSAVLRVQAGGPGGGAGHRVGQLHGPVPPED